MCKKRPGPRCSDHSQKGLTRSTERLDKNEARQDELVLKLDEAVPGSKTEARLQQNLVTVQAAEEHLLDEQAAAQLEYDATPRGQQELQAQQAITNLDEDERAELEERLFAAQARREWQRRVTRKIQEMERKHGLAYASLWAQEEFRKSHERLAEIQAELAAARAEDGGKKPATKPRAKGTPAQTKRRMSRQERMSRKARRLRHQRLLLALISGDLDRYILSIVHPETLITRAAQRLFAV